MDIRWSTRKGGAVHRLIVCCSVALLVALLSSYAGSGQEDPQSILARLPSPADFAGQPLVCLLQESSIHPDASSAAGDATRWVVRAHVELWVLDAEDARFLQEKGLPIPEASVGGKIIYARAILPSGTVIPGVMPDPLDPRIAEAMTDRGLAIPTSFVTFPSDTIEEGTVLEWEVELSERLADGLVWGTMDLGGALAIRCAVTVPEGQEVQWAVVGDADLRVRKDGTTYTFERMGTPVLSHDGVAATGLAASSAIVYSTVPSWTALAAAEREMLIDSSPESLELLGTSHGIVRGLETREAKAQALYAFVRDDIRYGLVPGWEADWAASPSMTLSRRMGDCKGKSGLLVSMLRAIGIEAYPALVSTTCRLRDLGERDWVIGPWQMDHVVVAVRGEDDRAWQILDPTCPGCVSLLGHEIWILDGPADSLGTFYKVPWPPIDDRTISCNVRKAMLDGGRQTISETVEIASGLADPIEARMENATYVGENVPRTAEGKWADELGMFLSDGKYSLVVQTGSSGAPTIVTYSAESALSCSSVCFERLSGLPSLDALSAFISLPSAGGSSDRVPFETEPIAWHCVATLEMPEGATLKLPADVHISAPGVTYDATYTLDGAQLSVARDLEITTDLVLPEDRDAFVRVVDTAQADDAQTFLFTW